MKEYLQKELRMPDTRIECLLSYGFQNAIFPSRRNIIRKLLSLATDTQIKYGDNIIIFFSGHGTSYSFPKDPQYNADGIPNVKESSPFTFPIEALCPADRGKLDERRVPIPDICDREINGILHQISRTKGHQITVILDCCHSGSVTRDIQDQGVRRVAPLGSPEAMLNAANETLSGYPDYQSVFSEDWRPDKSSHVTLAACRGVPICEGDTTEGGVQRRLHAVARSYSPVRPLHKWNNLRRPHSSLALFASAKSGRNGGITSVRFCGIAFRFDGWDGVRSTDMRLV